jgi:hypothetical protein
VRGKRKQSRGPSLVGFVRRLQYLFTRLRPVPHLHTILSSAAIYLYSLFRSHLSISIHKPLFLFVSVSRTNSCSANFTRPASRDARHAPETLMRPSAPLRDDRAPQYPCRHYISLSVTLITEPLTLLPTDSPAWVKIPLVYVHSQADWCVTHHRSPVSPPTK